MTDYSEVLLKPIVIDADTMGQLAEAELDLARIDERISNHPFLSAIRRQLLRLEAISSIIIDGSDVTYTELVALESSLGNTKPIERGPKSLFRRAQKLNMTNAAGSVRAILYMDAIDWISKNVKSHSQLEADVFDQIYSRYNENDIAQAQVKYLQTATSDRLSGAYPVRKQASTHKAASKESYISFLNSNKFTAVAQSEISHAMLEAIGLEQCKEDGYERAFTHIIFYRRGVLTKTVAPLAIGPMIDIEKHANAIYQNMASLAGTDESGATLQYRFEDSIFCTNATVRTMRIVAKALETLYAQWKSTLGLNSTAERKAVGLLLSLFLEYGYLTIDFAAKQMSKSFSTTSAAMQSLVSAGIVQEVGVVDKRRVFCATEVISFFESLLKRLSSGVTTTRDEALERIGSI